MKPISKNITKRCNTCNNETPLEGFRRDKNHSDGHQNICKECSARSIRLAYKSDPKYKENIRKRTDVVKNYIIEVKKAGCSRCDEKYVPCIDFHHLHGKDVPVSRMRSYGLQRVKDEIAKCILLCANCHRKEHYKNTED